MAIKAVWKVEGDNNEYDSEEQAQIAEALKKSNRYYRSDDLLHISQTVCANFLVRRKEDEVAELAEKIRKDILHPFGDPQ